MIEEQKQALIEYCEEVQGNNPESSVAYKVISVALAALTAQPVKLPGKCKVSDRAHETRQAYAEGLNHGVELARNAIIEAGYQVEG